MIAPELQDEVLCTADVAALMNVVPKTVTLWANKGKLPSFRTPGGHRRYYRALVLHRGSCRGCDRCTP